MRAVFERVRRRLLRFLRPRRIDSRLEDELRFHIESEIAAHVARGLSEPEARRRALADMGGVERWREEVRDQHPARALELLWRAVRYGTRELLRAPAYSLPGVATITLGVAALAAIVSLTSAVLLRPLPYREPAQLVALWEMTTQREGTRNVVRASVFEAWGARSRALDGVAALMPSSQVWTSNGQSERVFGAEVSPNMFALLGRQPLLGPGFSPGSPVGEVVVSHEFWKQRLGSDSAIVARPIRLGAKVFNVVGVMPRDFTPVELGWLGDQEFWLPLNITAEHRQWGPFLLVVGRRKPTVTQEILDRELAAISAQLISEKTLSEGWSAHAISLTQEMTGSVKPALVSLVMASLLLLAMVVTNIALLTMAYLRQRAPDHALRAALGATRSRLRVERLVTSTLLATVGAGLGMLLAALAVPILVRLLPQDVPRLDSVRFDTLGAASIVAAALLVTAVLALLPSRHAGVGHELSTQSHRLTSRGRATWLIVAEAALALVLSVLASLTVRSFDRLRSVDVGFDPSGLLAFRVAVDADSSQPAASPLVVFDRVLEGVRATPGIESAGMTSVRPFAEGGAATTVAPLGTGRRNWSAFPIADVRLVDSGYFAALSLTPIAGRLFSGREVPGKAIKVVVNEAMVRALWAREPNAVGKRFEWGMYGDEPPEIIGVVRDVRIVSPRQEARPTVYMSAALLPSEAFDVVVRTKLRESIVIASLREAVQRAAPGTPIYRVAGLNAVIAESMARERVTALLLAFFAAAAVLLVAVGVYGLFAGEVARGRREIGVRLALGQSASGLVGSMLSRALWRVLIGLAIGAVGSVVATRTLRTLLYGIAPSDGISYASAIVIVLVAALAATLFPALQAARVDPVRALRSE